MESLLSRLPTIYGYDHRTINHSERFVDSLTGRHTQLIECLCGHAETKILMNHKRNNITALSSGRILVPVGV